jgi:V/A-type H+-transporting ATPase subunit A
MPVSAREASIYTGITIAEYYRDQGHDVALMADSTSRWAQALREIAGRLGEMPVEEGYPAYLAARLAAFYERAGRVRTLGGDESSVTVIGAVSPPGGDFSEPVTRHTQRFVQGWLALDADLAHRRHYPAIDWLGSYALQADAVASWWTDEVGPRWPENRRRALDLLQEESGLQDLVQLVGPDALSDEQRWTLSGARLVREGFLQQNALHPVDAYAVPERQALLLDLLLTAHRLGRRRLAAGASLDEVQRDLDLSALIQLRQEVPNEDLDRLRERRDALRTELDDLGAEIDGAGGDDGGREEPDEPDDDTRGEEEGA